MAENLGRIHVGIELFNLGPSEGTNALIEDWRGDVSREFCKDARHDWVGQPDR
jgi:hypothetical protein